MTALAGLWDFGGRPDAGIRVGRMLAAQRCYGPADEARWDGSNIAMGRCLFAALPEDKFDRGPCFGGDGRFVLVADVRLDNRAELADALAIDAAAARAMPDVVVLMRCWERWEEATFERLLGDYAFVLWDASQRRLVLARDAVGMRPLHYHVADDFVAFASMPKGLHALPEVPYAPDEVRVVESLALLPEDGPRSFFHGISRVEGGCYVIVEKDRIRPNRHWDPTPESISRWKGDDMIEAFREQLDRAVVARLRGAGDVVGSHLSSGFDSTAVAATAARLMAPSGGRVIGFTSVPREGYAGPAPPRRIGNEGPLAATVAAMHCNMEQVLVRNDAEAIDRNWDRLFFLMERPVVNPCNQRWLDGIDAEAARRGIRVMLTAMFGNQSISYSGIELLPQLVRRKAFGRLARELRALVRNREMRWRGALASAFGPWVPPRLWSALVRLQGGVAAGSAEDTSAIRRDRADAIELSRTARERGLDFSYRPLTDPFGSRLWTIRRLDRANFIKAALASHGVDQRDPTADRRLIEFCLSLPTEAFLADGTTCLLAKRSLADRLPAALLAARHKGYQSVDWHEGLVAARESLANELERLDDVPAAVSILDLAGMRAWLHRLPETGWERAEAIRIYRIKLLRGAVVGHFLRRASRPNA